MFLTGKVIAGDDHDQCFLAPQATLNADECMAFDQGAVDFMAKSRDRQVLVRRLRRVVELTKPTTDVAVRERPAIDKLLLKQETSRAFWNGVDVGLTLAEYKLIHLLVSKRRLFRDLSRGLRSPTLRRLYRWKPQ